MKQVFTLGRLIAVGVVLAFIWSANLAQRPELIVQSGHVTGSVKVALSQDGRILATASYDNTIKVWDVATGTQLRTLAGHRGWINSVVFNSDGSKLASASGDNSIKIWDVRTGSEERTLSVAASGARAVAFSPDGQTLASGWCDRTVKLWNASNGLLIDSLSGPRGPVEVPSTAFPIPICVDSIAFSFDGKLLASGSSDGATLLWDVSSRVLRREFPGIPKEISAVAFSTDGVTLASATGSNVDDSIRIWDVATGRPTFMVVGMNGIGAILFAPDGRTLLCGVRDNTIRRWDLSTGTSLPNLVGHASSVNSLAISPDGVTVASGDASATIILWNLQASSLVRVLPGYFKWIDALAWSPDGKMLLAGNTQSYQGVNVWDLTTGVLTRSLNTYAAGVQAIAFTRDGNTLATASGNGTIGLWQFSTSSLLRGVAAHSEPNSFTTVSLVFSFDGRTLVTGAGNNASNAVRIWDVATGTQLRSLDGLSNQVASVAYSPNGKTVAIGTYSGAIKLWDTTTSEIRELIGHRSWVKSMAFTSDGQTLVSGSFDNTVRVWDTSTGKSRESVTNRGPSDVTESINQINAIALSSNDRVIASGGGDGIIRLWDVATGKELRSLSGHTSRVKSLAFHPHGKLLASGAEDSTVKLWDPQTGKEIATLSSVTGTDWMVVTPDGLFDGSSNTWNKILWRFNNNTFDFAPVEAFFNEFYYPGLLTDIFQGKNPRASADISQLDRRQPKLKLMLADSQTSQPLTARNLDIKIEVSEALPDKDHKIGSGARDIRLFRNGSLVKVWHGDVLKGQSLVTLAATIPIVAGGNHLTAYAFNRDNIKSGDSGLTVIGADNLKRKGIAYLLAVGVNEYANPQYNLRYAVADSQEFGTEFKVQQAKLNNYERLEVISLNDRNATKANILKSLADLSTRIQPEDALIVFFAGHGTAPGESFLLDST